MNIDTDYKFDDLILVQHLKSIDSEFLPQIKEVYEKVKDILNNRIPVIFPDYTLHNTAHSFRIMQYMSKIVNDYSNLSELEIVMLIYSALLHDIGMAVSEKDVEDIKSDNFSFCDIKFSRMKQVIGVDEKLALQEYVRRIHASLSARYIRNELKDKLVIPKLTTLDFVDDLALICEAHTEDYDWIKSHLSTYEIRGDYHYNPQFIATILRLADILDIDSNRTPFNLYKLIAPKGISDKEWQQHYTISNNEKIILNDKTQQKKIVFYGHCKNASIHRKILDYISWVKNELINAVSIVSTMHPQYTLIYDTSPEINIKAEGYTFSDYKMTLEFKAISALLMGEKIYGSKTLGLRELIQNSIDSCRLRQEVENSKLEFGEDAYLPVIKVILDKDKNQAIIKDNGTGMSMNIIKKHFLNIGVSYYKSLDFSLIDFEYKPIGNFGIGFLSCFMLSDEVKVKTRHYQSKDKYLIELEKSNEWTSLTVEEDVEFYGTEVILNYTDFMNVFENKHDEVKDFMNLYFLTDGIQFELINKNEKKSDKISNPIIHDTKLEKGLIKIELSNYLNEIEGYALIKKKSNFIKNFNDINYIGDLYLFTKEGNLEFIQDIENLSIDDFFVNQKLVIHSLPIVEEEMESEFLNGLNFTEDDSEAVIRKLESKLKWISIISIESRLKNEVSYLCFEPTGISNHQFLNPFEEYNQEGLITFEMITNLGHSKSCPTRSTRKEFTMFEGTKNELYLPFNLSENYSRKIRGWYFSNLNNFKRQELFIRNVLIKRFNFDLPILAEIFEINSIVVNLKSKKFIPDISRNNMDEASSKTINYIIGKAIHLGACQTLTLSEKEKTTMESFISKYYSTKTDFEKE